MPPPDPGGPGDDLAWLPWGPDAFRRARTGRRPVLLSLTTHWSAASRDMHARVFADARIAGLIADRFVPVHVDADRRPDLAERYRLRGFPTTAFLTPDGAILTAGGHIDVDRLTPLLREVADQYARRADELAGAHTVPPPVRTAIAGATPDFDAAEWASEVVLGELDRDRGGFGRSPKFPLTWPVEFALAHADGNAALAAAADLTLTAIGWTALWDPDEGGFHRLCRGEDWSDPERVKLLETQADLIRLLLIGSVVGDRPDFRDRAADAIAYADRRLADQDRGGFFASESVDPATGGWDRDPTLLVDANARMVRAYLAAGEVLDRPACARFAIRTLERLLPVVYRRAAGVAHYVDDERGRMWGLLGDQVLVAAALVDAHEATADPAYRDLADELMRSCLRRLWGQDDLGLVDRVATPAGAGDVGLLSQPLHPLDLNCLAVQTLLRLFGLTEDRELVTWAERILKAHAGSYRATGTDGTAYALAVDAFGAASRSGHAP